MTVGHPAQAPATRATIAERLRCEAAEIADRFARELHTVHPLYRGVTDTAFLQRSYEASLGSTIAFASWLDRGTRSLSCEEESYLRAEAADSAAQLFPLEALIEPIQMGIRVLWDWTVEACRTAEASPELERDLLGELTDFMVEIQRVLTGSYVEARFEPDDEHRHAQHELLELVLAGRPIGREIQTRLMSGYRLGVTDLCVVVVAVAVDGPDPDAVTRATAIARQRPANHRWLAADRGDEIVVIIPVPAGTSGIDDVIDAVAQWLRDLRRVHGIDLRAGLSTTCGLGEAPDRYVEAQEAARIAHGRPDGLCALPRTRLFDYLTNRSDATASRLVAAEIQRLRIEDDRSTGALTATLTALADADLNVRRAAAALFVHPNTVHYRIKRINELTGHDPRRFHDLVELLAALSCGASTP